MELGCVGAVGLGLAGDLVVGVWRGARSMLPGRMPCCTSEGCGVSVWASEVGD